jgi:hypothetical protein
MVFCSGATRDGSNVNHEQVLEYYHNYRIIHREKIRARQNELAHLRNIANVIRDESVFQKDERQHISF